MYDYNKYRDIFYQIIGAAMDVHRDMGFGLDEPIYNECLSMELHDRGVDNIPERKLPVFYKGRMLNKYYRTDILVGDVVVELKSVKEIVPAHRAQLFNYLRLTKKPVGLLLNFGANKLQGERYAYIEDINECVLLDKNMNLLYEAIPDWEYDESYVNGDDEEDIDEVFRNYEDEP